MTGLPPAHTHDEHVCTTKAPQWDIRKIVNPRNVFAYGETQPGEGQDLRRVDHLLLHGVVVEDPFHLRVHCLPRHQVEAHAVPVGML